MTGSGVDQAGPGRCLAITGTGTDVGKTVATAALAALLRGAGEPVRVAKPLQTGLAPGEPGDADEVARLAGVTDLLEVRRLPDPLAPETAARVAGLAQPTLDELVPPLRRFAGAPGVTLVEGAGGVLVRLGTDLTILDLAAALGAPVLVVSRAGLGALNEAELTVRAIRDAGLHCAGIVVGSMPADPDLATRCNLEDLPRLTGVPLLGEIPEGAGRLDPEGFRRRAAGWFGPAVAQNLTKASY